MKKWLPVLLVAFLMVVHPDADARRMGGGKSFGQQSGNVSQRNAAPANNPGAPTQNANSAANKPAPAAPAAAAPKKPWGAMLGGLAAGLGLAWLAHSLGLGEGFAQILMFALMAIAASAIFKMVVRARSSARSAPAAASPFAFQGAGAGSPSPESAPLPRGYSPNNVGNDASARPWEGSNMAGGSMIGSALAGSQNWGVPEGFDAAGFIEAAKRNFTTLQAA